MTKVCTFCLSKDHRASHCPKRPKLVKMNALMLGKLCALMIPGDLTCTELAEETGLHYMTVIEYGRGLHKAKAIHIAGWEQDTRGRYTHRLYKLGPGKDVPRPRLTDTQRSARYREKKRAALQVAVLAGKAAYVQSGNGQVQLVRVPEVA